MKWIKHDTDANQDAKLQNVLLDYGLEGYGLYWYCIELIAGKVDKDNITFELEHDARIIARNTGSTPQKVEEMMRYFVQIGLFENADGVITCLKLARRLDKSMTGNSEMRALIENMRNHDKIMIGSETIMQEEKRSEEIILDKKDNVRPDGLTDAKIKESMQSGFKHFWEIWKNCKKSLGVKNNSTPAETRKKWDKYFSPSWWKSHTSADYDEEVNLICCYAVEAHGADDEFNPHVNMMTGRFFTLQGWKSE